MRFIISLSLVWLYSLVVIGVHELSAHMPLLSLLLYTITMYATATWVAYKSEGPHQW